jgi:ribose transport system substrate-binding protein
MITRRRFLKATTAVAGAAVVHELGWPRAGWSQQKPWVIVQHTKNLVNPFYKACLTGGKMSLERFKDRPIEWVQTTPARPDNIEDQIRLVEDWVTKKPDAMIFVPIDYVALVPVIKKANDAGIPIINYVNMMAPGCKFETFVGVDDVQIGYELARYVFKAVGYKGKAVIIDGPPGSSAGKDRRQGFDRALKENPGVELLAAQPANWTRLLAVQVMENFLQRFPQIDVVLSANDEMGLGAIEALKEAGLVPGTDVMVLSVDATAGAFKSMLDGDMSVTVECNPLLAPQVYEAALKAANGEELPKWVPSQEGVFRASDPNLQEIADGRKY